MNKSIMHNYSKNLLLGIILVLSISLIIMSLVFNSFLTEYRSENAAIDKLFAELSKNPELTVTFLNPIEGRVLVNLRVGDKGNIKIFYSEYGIDSLYAYNDQFADVDCFYVNDKGTKTKYAYTESLQIGKDTEFYTWFPFEIDSLSDLIDHYDNVKSSIDSLPHNPQLVEFNDNSGQRHVRSQSDPKFMISKEFNGKQVVCDLYTVSL